MTSVVVVWDEPTPPFTMIVRLATDGMLNQILFDVLSSVVLVVMIKIHVCSEPPGLSDTELTICLGFQFRVMDTMIINNERF